ncbi:hypothetical protein CLV24_10191 [Pontibacter ummariensis]|uniref:Uncharacterized protein n=1 Tax=Pontibacter ummariensis TaxID=1610492 RepID=A0A239B1Y0_9BACT|nr:hypothetical protein CLV24_10191 [Pontibacter ummariensis]SNS01799.1 hypothetical protein SAMN06296052_10191 [Pontibacter ummariensis]
MYKKSQRYKQCWLFEKFMYCKWVVFASFSAKMFPF